ncbi:hypothetical protein BC835DRAFT_698624 [Cytidiella melzeri]|nr:hypothetical protein BC835DRAFT_698624 [Cytidiella melzeri]
MGNEGQSGTISPSKSGTHGPSLPSVIIPVALVCLLLVVTVVASWCCRGHRTASALSRDISTTGFINVEDRPVLWDTDIMRISHPQCVWENMQPLTAELVGSSAPTASSRASCISNDRSRHRKACMTSTNSAMDTIYHKRRLLHVAAIVAMPSSGEEVGGNNGGVCDIGNVNIGIAESWISVT